MVWKVVSSYNCPTCAIKLADLFIIMVEQEPLCYDNNNFLLCAGYYAKRLTSIIPTFYYKLER